MLNTATSRRLCCASSSGRLCPAVYGRPSTHRGSLAGVCPPTITSASRTSCTRTLLGRQFYNNAAQRMVITRAQGGMGDDDIDVAVFRFTLGIPGFDDRFLPRVVGLVIASALAINNVLGAQPAPDEQVRSEYLVFLLAVLCFFVPDVEERLREVQPGRGRQKTAESIPGSTNGFFLDASLDEAAKKELAWASYALLRNTNCCGVVMVREGHVLLARGALGSEVVTAGNAAASLAAMSKDLEGLVRSGPVAEVLTGTSPRLWLADKLAVLGSGVDKAKSIPAGAESMLVQHGGVPGSAILVFSERSRALAEREQGWVAAIAKKLKPFLSA